MKILFILLTLVSCAHSHHQSTTDVIATPRSLSNPKLQNKVVTATGEQFVILSLAFSTDYVEEAVKKIEALCPNGVITPLTTTYSTDLGFLSWTNKVELTGNCLSVSK